MVLSFVDQVMELEVFTIRMVSLASSTDVDNYDPPSA